MKKSLLALAVLGAYAGVASAQSSVTLYGTLDVAGRYVKADGQSSKLSESTDGINSSQLGFRGVEDLGGGLRAGFTLLAGVNPDTGTSNTTTPAVGALQSKFWNRRSTVSLFAPFGELRLGRDYTPTFWNMTLFDPFGTNGLGSSTNVRQLYNGTRQDNTIGYFLPSNLGGFYGQAMVGAPENGTSTDRPVKYWGGRVGFAAGPFDIAFSASQETFAVPFVVAQAAGGPIGGLPGGVAAVGQKQKTYNIGGSWDFGRVKILGYYDQDELGNAKEKMGAIGVTVPLGQSEIHAGYAYSKLTGTLLPPTSREIDQAAVTYQYNLSKRTAVYTTYSLLKNRDNTNQTLSGANGNTTLGGKSQGAEFGVRHFF